MPIISLHRVRLECPEVRRADERFLDEARSGRKVMDVVHWQPDSELHLWIPLRVLLAAGTWKQPPGPGGAARSGAVGGGPAAARGPQPVPADAGKLKSGGPARGLGAGGHYMHNLNATCPSYLSSLNVPADLAL